MSLKLERIYYQVQKMTRYTLDASITMHGLIRELHQLVYVVDAIQHVVISVLCIQFLNFERAQN